MKSHELIYLVFALPYIIWGLFFYFSGNVFGWFTFNLLILIKFSFLLSVICSLRVRSHNPHENVLSSFFLMVPLTFLLLNLASFLSLHGFSFYDFVTLPSPLFDFFKIQSRGKWSTAHLVFYPLLILFCYLKFKKHFPSLNGVYFAVLITFSSNALATLQFTFVPPYWTRWVEAVRWLLTILWEILPLFLLSDIIMEKNFKMNRLTFAVFPLTIIILVSYLSPYTGWLCRVAAVLPFLTLAPTKKRKENEGNKAFPDDVANKEAG